MLGQNFGILHMAYVILLYWVEDSTAYKHDDLFCILDVSQLLMVYMYIYVLCWAWTLKNMIDEMFLLGVDPKAHD